MPALQRMDRKAGGVGGKLVTHRGSVGRAHPTAAAESRAPLKSPDCSVVLCQGASVLRPDCGIIPSTARAIAVGCAPHTTPSPGIHAEGSAGQAHPTAVAESRAPCQSGGSPTAHCLPPSVFRLGRQPFAWPGRRRWPGSGRSGGRGRRSVRAFSCRDRRRSGTRGAR